MRPVGKFRYLFLPTLAAVWLVAALPATAAEGERATIAAADFALAAYAGKVVVLDFWATWCKPCEKSMPWLSYLQRTYGPRGLQVIAVSVDKDEAAARAKAAALESGIVVVLDPKGLLATQYKLGGMPSTFLIDGAGKVVASHIGFREADAGARETEVAAMLPASARKEGK